MLEGVFFVISQALGRASSFTLGWGTSLFFGQIPGGKERIVSMLSALALAWVLIAYVGGIVGAVALGLEAAGVITLRDPSIDDARIAAILLATAVLPPIIMLIAELSHLTPGVSFTRYLRNIPLSYPVALSLGLGVALMLVVGPIVLLRRRRAGLRTHHIPVLVADGQFDRVVEDIADELRLRTDRAIHVGTLGGMWGLPMRAMRFAAAQLFDSVVRTEPVIVVAGRIEVAAYAMDVNVTAPEDEAYALRAALYKRFGVGHMHLTWSSTSQPLERRLWELREREGLTREEFDRRLARIERDIDRAAIGSDEWNVLYRVVLQLRDQGPAQRARSA